MEIKKHKWGFEEVFTVPEVSKILKTTNRHVYKLLVSGEIKGSKIGGLWRITAREISRLLGSHDNKGDDNE